MNFAGERTLRVETYTCRQELEKITIKRSGKAKTQMV
jgi:hypothetical protein